MVSWQRIRRIADVSLLREKMRRGARKDARALRWAAVGAWTVAMAVLAWVLSGWFWDFLEPVPVKGNVETVKYKDYEVAARAVSSRHLFGIGTSGPNADAAPLPRARIRVLGGMTRSPDAPGFAILMEEGKPALAVVEGEDLSPGVKLVEVLAGRIRLEVEGRSETVEIDEPQASDLRPASGKVGPGLPQVDREVAGEVKSSSKGRVPSSQ